MAERKTIARPYAKAIFNLAKSAGMLSQWYESLQLLVMIVTEHNIQELIKNQIVSASNKAKFIIDLAGDDLQPIERNLVTILAQYSRLALLPDIAAIFKDLQEKAEHKIVVTVKAANKMPEATAAKLLTSLNKKFKQDVIIDFVADQHLLAGVKIKTKDSIIDYSMRGQLEELRKVLEG